MTAVESFVLPEPPRYLKSVKDRQMDVQKDQVSDTVNCHSQCFVSTFDDLSVVTLPDDQPFDELRSEFVVLRN